MTWKTLPILLTILLILTTSTATAANTTDLNAMNGSELMTEMQGSFTQTETSSAPVNMTNATSIITEPYIQAMGVFSNLLGSIGGFNLCMAAAIILPIILFAGDDIGAIVVFILRLLQLIFIRLPVALSRALFGWPPRKTRPVQPGETSYRKPAKPVFGKPTYSLCVNGSRMELRPGMTIGEHGVHARVVDSSRNTVTLENTGQGPWIVFGTPNIRVAPGSAITLSVGSKVKFGIYNGEIRT